MLAGWHSRGAGGVGVVGTGWDVTTAVFLQSFDVSAKENSPRDVAFKPDGLKMYVIGSTSDRVHEYDVSPAWDISTAVFLQSFNVVAQESTARSVAFRPDGLKMYIVGTASDTVYEYDVSTAWDVTTAVFLQSFDVSAQETTPTGLAFKPDGLKMYVIGAVSDTVHEYDVSPAWDVTTAVFLQSFDVSAQETNPSGLAFKPDGLKMYIIGSTSDRVHEYDVSPAWDISTAVLLQSFSVAAQEASPSGLAFRPDGLKMYITGVTVDSVHEYDLG
jgi:sugar lactone lactonase YvrE